MTDERFELLNRFFGHIPADELHDYLHEMENGAEQLRYWRMPRAKLVELAIALEFLQGEIDHLLAEACETWGFGGKDSPAWPIPDNVKDAIDGVFAAHCVVADHGELDHTEAVSIPPVGPTMIRRRNGRGRGRP